VPSSNVRLTVSGCVADAAAGRNYEPTPVTSHTRPRQQKRTPRSPWPAGRWCTALVATAFLSRPISDRCGGSSIRGVVPRVLPSRRKRMREADNLCCRSMRPRRRRCVQIAPFGRARPNICAGNRDGSSDASSWSVRGTQLAPPVWWRRLAVFTPTPAPCSGQSARDASDDALLAAGHPRQKPHDLHG
jgi:hypothetical protein